MFGSAGVLGYLADASVTLLLEEALGVYLARVPAFLAAATVTWVINRNYTFGKNSTRHNSLFKEYLHYLSVMIFGLMANYATYAVSITILKDRVDYAILLAIAMGSLAGMIFNFINSKKYIYNKPSGNQ